MGLTEGEGSSVGKTLTEGEGASVGAAVGSVVGTSVGETVGDGSVVGATLAEGSGDGLGSVVAQPTTRQSTAVRHNNKLTIFFMIFLLYFRGDTFPRVSVRCPDEINSLCAVFSLILFSSCEKILFPPETGEAGVNQTAADNLFIVKTRSRRHAGRHYFTARKAESAIEFVISLCVFDGFADLRPDQCTMPQNPPQPDF